MIQLPRSRNFVTLTRKQNRDETDVVMYCEEYWRGYDGDGGGQGEGGDGVTRGEDESVGV